VVRCEESGYRRCRTEEGGHRSDESADRESRVEREREREREVHTHFGLAIFGEENIGGLDVTMHDVLAVQICQSL
jgi:hypothetical protein